MIARAPLPTVLRAGPYLGIREAQAGSRVDLRYASAALNMVVRDTGVGMIARPGFAKQTYAPAGAWQGAKSVRTSAGVPYTFYAGGGHIYRQDPTGFATPTDVTPSGGGAPTISAAAVKIWFGFLGDVLVVHDGVNPPWTCADLTTTPLVGTVLQLDAGSSDVKAFGPPTIYQGQMVFIRKDVRTMITWSRPNDPTTGYAQTGFDQTWNLIQTNAEPLYAIRGRNDAFWYWRQNSVSGLVGELSSAQGESTHDHFSTGLGTLCPDSLCEYGDGVFFLDNKGLPAILEIGTGLTSLAEDCRLTFAGVNASLLTDYTHAAYDHDLRRVVVLHPVNGVTNGGGVLLTRLFVFDPAARTFQGEWTIASTTYFAGTWRVAFMREQDQTTGDMLWLLDQEGLAARKRSNAQPLYFDTVGAPSSIGVTNSVTSPPLGGKLLGEYVFGRLAALATCTHGGPSYTMAMSYQTPHGAGALSATVSKNVPVGGDDIDTWFEAGAAIFGRWMTLTTTRTGVSGWDEDNGFTLLEHLVEGVPDSDAPSRP